jgi:hypothetical protein
LLARYDGNLKKFGPPYEPPAYSGPEPNPPGFEEDGKTYYGSCHCKAVTVAVRMHGSLEDGTYKDLILECNCSICQRVRIFSSSFLFYSPLVKKRKKKKEKALSRSILSPLLTCFCS